MDARLNARREHGHEKKLSRQPVPHPRERPTPAGLARDGEKRLLEEGNYRDKRERERER